jgi:hypothetical protein
MSKDKKSKAAPETAQQTTDATPEVETPATETPPTKPSKSAKSDFTCPACEGTAGIKLGEPFESGKQKLQYVKCCNEKCNHVAVETLS